ncbi:type VII secretion target [Actinomadura fibrosa]|uniref:Type VII secretion target n=1 Tax=Actinomadura fibrosa TaxID=111802 RepID=A0ABW2Y3X6_9ACTN|nr:type VII secretion target [Actinomadura fibrosa]
MGNGFEVDKSALDTHAGKVDKVAARADKASEAAGASATGGWQMYGALCSPLIVPTLAALYGDSDDMVKKAAELGRSMAGGLRSTRQNYEAVEKAIEALTKQAR